MTGMAVAADIAPSHPAVLGTILVRTKGLLRVNRSPTSSGAREQRRQGKGSLLVGLGGMLTRFTAWLVVRPAKGLGGVVGVLARVAAVGWSWPIAARLCGHSQDRIMPSQSPASSRKV